MLIVFIKRATLAARAVLATIALAACGGGEAPFTEPTPALPPPSAAVPSSLFADPVRQQRVATLASSLPLTETELMDWAEGAYSDFFPTSQSNRSSEPYIYRYYPETRTYLGVAGDGVYVLGPVSGDTLLAVGRLGNFRCRVHPDTCVPPALTLVVGRNNRIDAVAGGAVVNAPVTIAGAATALPLSVRVVDAPPFVATRGMDVVVDPSGLRDAGTYRFQLVVADDSTDLPLGQFSVVVEVSAITAAGAVRSLSNGQAIVDSQLALSLSAPPNAFVSGQSAVKLETRQDSGGRSVLVVTMSEAPTQPIQILSTGGASPARASARTASALRAPAGEECEPSDYAPSALPGGGKCLMVWKEPTIVATCGAGPSASPETGGSTQSGFTYDSKLPAAAWPGEATIAPTCSARRPISLVLGMQTWASLAGPITDPSPDAPIHPILLVNGFFPSGLGGGPGTWGNTADALTAESAYTYKDTKLVVYEFRWATNTTFQDAALKLIQAISEINKRTGKKVSIVAHSFGGLLARTALQLIAAQAAPNTAHSLDNKVAKLVTIGTPHSGIAREEKTLYGHWFPRGMDSGPIRTIQDVVCENRIESLDSFLCQISSYQAGADVSNTQFRAPDEASPGYIVAKLAETKTWPAGFEGIFALIGLRMASTPEPPSYQQLPGDGLISYGGQRFSLGDSGPLRLGYLANLTPAERGVEEKALSLEASPDFETIKFTWPPPIADINHSTILKAVAPATFSEPYIDFSPDARALSAGIHPTWIELKKIFLDGPLRAGAVPGPFSITSGVATCDNNLRTGPSVTVTWTESADATSYEITRDGPDGIKKGIDAPLRTYTSTEGIKAGQTFTFSVIAKRGEVRTESRAIKVTVPSAVCGTLPSAPVAPVPATGDPTSPGPTQSVTAGLSWADVTSATTYRVKVVNSYSGSTVFDAIVGTNSIVPSTLAPGGKYQWYVASCNADACSQFSRPMYFQTGTAGAVSSAPVTTSLSPMSMTADASLQTLTLYGRNFAAGNVVQFKWSTGPGANVWTNASSTPTVNSSGQITVSMNPGTVSDTIYVRVCASSGSISCSSGSQYVSVTASPLIGITSIYPTSVAADGPVQRVTIYGRNLPFPAAVQFKWGAGPGANVWTDAGQVGFNNGGTIKVSMKPSAISDTVYVRVCTASGSIICSSGAHSLAVTATPRQRFNFSYVFANGVRVSGSFDGVAQGNRITRLTNISANVNGVSLNNGSMENYGWHYTQQLWLDEADTGIASFDGTENAFLFRSGSNYFSLAPYVGGVTDSATVLLNGVYSHEGASWAGWPSLYSAGRWTITQ